MFENIAAIWAAVAAGLETRLFSIGETAVTAVGILRVAFVVLIATWVSRALRGALTKVAARWPRTDRSALYALGRILHYFLLLIGLVIGLSTVGVDFTNVTVLLGALGIGIGFALQDIVANFVAGLIILFERHLRVGDFIELESGLAGEVRETGCAPPAS